MGILTEGKTNYEVKDGERTKLTGDGETGLRSTTEATRSARDRVLSSAKKSVGFDDDEGTRRAFDSLRRSRSGETSGESDEEDDENGGDESKDDAPKKSNKKSKSKKSKKDKE